MGYMRVLAILQLSSRRSTFTAVQFIHVKIQSFFGCSKILADGLQTMKESRLDVAQLMMFLSGHIHIASLLLYVCQLLILGMNVLFMCEKARCSRTSYPPITEGTVNYALVYMVNLGSTKRKIAFKSVRNAHLYAPQTCKESLHP